MSLFREESLIRYENQPILQTDKDIRNEKISRRGHVIIFLPSGCLGASRLGLETI